MDRRRGRYVGDAEVIACEISRLGKLRFESLQRLHHADTPLLDQLRFSQMLGQPVHIKNSDMTLHNVHGYKGASTLFNQAELPGQPPMIKLFPDADQMVKLKCDVHPWMTGWVLVSSHPFFAVTGDDGTFKITGVPPGSYTVEAWHELYGTKTAELTVTDKPAETAFQFASAP